MKRITALFTAILFSAISISITAETITTAIAKETADSFLALDNEWHHKTDANIRLVEKDGLPAYYVVEYTAGGWAIVSAHSSSSPIIGYNTTGEFAAPAPVSELLDFNAKLITARAVEIGDIEHIGWKRVKQRRAVAETNNTPDIAPLITINLNQTYPFNTYCPLINGENALVGCVAVGMTQAMMVQGYPQRPSGSYSYTCENTGKHSINYDAQPAYDWNAINNCETTGNYDEVARLLYHAGVSVDMQYGLTSSGTQTDYVAEALIRNFGYDKKIVYTTARHPDNTKWLELIINELAHGRVVVYGGTGEEGGHCWNIDGWKQSTQMVHCNWGWSGYGNGYFSLDNLVDSYQDISFLYNHRAVFGVAALTAAPYDILLHNTQFAIDTEAGTHLSYVEVLSTDNNATYSYELFGHNGTQSPYQITNNKFTSTERVTDSDKFKYVRIKATNTTTGQSYEKEFNILIVSANTHKLIGSYKAFANSAFSSYPDEEWEVSITADKYDANKLWIQPVCTFGGLSPTSITAIYATYNETASTLTMPIGQILYESPSYKMITGVSRDYDTIETSGNITLQVTTDDKGVVISLPTGIVFGVGNTIGNEWWYQALENITFTKQQNNTAPYGIELSTTSFAIGTSPNTPLANVVVLCDDKNAIFNYEVYDRVGNTSPYMVVNNTLMSSETIADNDTFKYMRIKATNTLTGEAYEQEFEIQIVENMASMFEGTYSAYAQSAFADYPDETWQVNITADSYEPNKIWIQPVCLFGGLDASYISPIYATYDVTRGVLTMPLGQVLYQQDDTYQMITGSTIDGNNINTTDNIELQVTKTDTEVKISFDPNYIFGVGDAINNAWWYQALLNITYTQSLVSEIVVDGIYYNITSEELKTAEVTFRGNTYDEYLDEYTGSIVIPSTITLNGSTYSVTAIGDKAFAKCTGMTDITLPSSISVIGEQSFAFCSALTQVVHANSITQIKEAAFYACTDLPIFIFPSETITIGAQAFRGSGLREVVLTENMVLSDAVFYECNNLTSIIISDGVTTIPTWTFGYCPAFTMANFPSSVTTICDYAFYNCQGLKEIYIPANITNIGTDAFNCDSALESIYVAADNPVYDSRERCNALIETATNVLITGCKNTVIPDNVETIAAWAFGYCTGLTDIVIGSGVTKIEAFAFTNCSNLASIVISEHVTEIGDAAFAYCSALNNIEVKAVNPPVIYEMTFENVDKSIELIVPTESIEVYRTTEYWREFTNIKGISGINAATGNDNIDVYVNNNTIIITGATDDTVVNIYAMNGILVCNTTVCNVANITLPRGMYIVQVQETTHKIAL